MRRKLLNVDRVLELAKVEEIICRRAYATSGSRC